MCGGRFELSIYWIPDWSKEVGELNAALQGYAGVERSFPTTHTTPPSSLASQIPPKKRKAEEEVPLPDKATRHSQIQKRQESTESGTASLQSTLQHLESMIEISKTLAGAASDAHYLPYRIEPTSANAVIRNTLVVLAKSGPKAHLFLRCYNSLHVPRGWAQLLATERFL
jgi:hypothetical protein